MSGKPKKDTELAGPITVRDGATVYRSVYEPIHLDQDAIGAALPAAFMPHMAGRYVSTMALPAA